jgi:hypothetical protein
VAWGLGEKKENSSPVSEELVELLAQKIMARLG